MNTITQGNWLKGLNAVMSKLTKREGSLNRISNLLYTRRGGLVTCDGTRNIAGFFNSPYPMDARSPVVTVGQAILRGNPQPYPSVAISSTLAGTPIIITTSTPHGLRNASPNNVVVIAGSANSDADGIWTITYISATQFSLNDSSSTGSSGAGGTATKYTSVDVFQSSEKPLTPIFITYDSSAQKIAVFEIAGPAYDPVLLTPKSILYSGAIPLIGQNLSQSSAFKKRFPQVVNVGNVGVIFCGNDASPIVLGNVNSQIQRPGYSYFSDYAVQAGGQTNYPNQFGGAHGVYHLGRLWILNTAPVTSGIDGPSCLRMSDIGISGPVHFTDFQEGNQTFLDKDDGTEGMGLASFTIAEAGISPTPSIVAFKNYSAYTITGVLSLDSSGQPAFQISRVQTDMGCVAPRTIQFVPGFGIMRLSHLGIALFTGTRDQLVSEEIRPYLFGGQDDIVPMNQARVDEAFATVTTNPPMYVMAIPRQDDTQHSFESGVSVVYGIDNVLNDVEIQGVLQVPYSRVKIQIDGIGSPNTFEVLWSQGPSISDLTNATPIVMKVSSNHGLQDSDQVKVSGALGNTAANGSWYVKVTGYGSGSVGLYSDSGLTTPSVGSGAYTGSATYVPKTITGIAITGNEQEIPLSTSRQFSGLIVRFGSLTGHGLNNSWTVNGSISQGNLLGCRRLLCYDMILKCWTVVDLPIDAFVTSGAQIRVAGKQPVTVFGSATRSGIWRWQNGDDGWHPLGTGAPRSISWSFQPDDFPAGSPAQRAYFRRAVLRSKASAGTVNATIKINGLEKQVAGLMTYRRLRRDAVYGAAWYGSSLYGEIGADLLATFDIGQTALSLTSSFDGAGPIEVEAIDYHVVQKPAGAFARAS